MSAALLLYIYIGYPSLLAVFSRTKMRLKVDTAHTESLPTVTVVVSAYNEAAVIAAKLNNTLSQKYPSNKMDIIVVSDCSDDATDDIVESYDDSRVRLLRMPHRAGKSTGLNYALEIAQSEIIVFTDANAMFGEDSLSNLVSKFDDQSVGVVTGQQRYAPMTEKEQTQEGLYWRYESAIKALESRIGNLIGGDGAIMALRRQLFFPLEADDLSDFLLPMRMALAGYRNVYAADAYCYEELADSYDKEFRRKVRIVNRAWRSTLKCSDVLNVFKHPLLGFCVWSHKVLRWFAGVWMILVLSLNIVVLEQHTIYQVTLAGQLSFYLLALLGFAFRHSAPPAICSLPYYFCATNIAALVGISEHYFGKTYATWNPPRS